MPLSATLHFRRYLFPTTLAKLDNFNIRPRLYYTAMLQNCPIISHHINKFPSLGARTLPKTGTNGATGGSHQLRDVVRGHSRVRRIESFSHFDSLHSREDGGTASEDDHKPIYKDLSSCPCHSFEMKHGRVHETEWHAMQWQGMTRQRFENQSHRRHTHQAKLPTKLTNLSRSFAPAQLTR